MKSKQILFFIAGIILAVISCKKEESDLLYTNKEIYALMQEYYLWYEQMPEVNPGSYTSPYDLLNDLVYEPIDRWSFLMPTEEFDRYFTSGEFVGHGFSSKMDAQDNLRVAFIYTDSDLYPQGVRRGWIIKEVNGTVVTPSNYTEPLFGASEAGVTNTIIFEDTEGNEVELTSTKKTVNINTVLYSGIYETGSKKVGYCVYESFIEPSIEELDTVFAGFLNAGVTDLILDLRYNGGGSTAVTLYLASLIAGNKADDKVLVSYLFNGKNSYKNKNEKMVKKQNSVNIMNLVVIATKGTASASEVIINGLEPYLNVIQVGSDSHGKPVGMIKYNLDRMDYVLVPITFKLANATGYGDYYDGLPADIYADDDLSHDFGDTTETCLAASLAYIETGVITPTVKRTGIERSVIKEFSERFNILIGE